MPDGDIMNVENDAKGVDCIGAVDQGTQSSRFTIYDKRFNILVSHRVLLRQEYPRTGWVEQNPLEILESVRQAIREAIQKAKASYPGLKLKSIGITNQRETTVVWDKLTGLPLHNAIVWLDSRTRNICTDIEQEYGGKDAFRSVTGLPVSTYFSSYKLKWMLENVPEVRKAADEDRCMFGTVDSWLLYNLTGGVNGGQHTTDVTNASRTNFMALSSLKWDEDMIRCFGASKVIMPEIKSNSELYGNVHDESLPEINGVPLAGCLGDQQAAMLGQKCVEGEAKNTYGTGCFVLLHTGIKPVTSSHGLLTTVAYQLGDSAPCYALEGAIAIAGQGISWLKDQLGIVESPEEMEKIASSVPNSGGVYFVPAFGGLLAPWWQPDARGAILGLTQFSTKAHVARALMDAICFQTKDVIEAMKKDADLDGLKRLFVDGGASKNDLLMQMQADILQLPIVRPHDLETTSLGAAIAAGIAVGVWSSETIFKSKLSENITKFCPEIDSNKADVRYEKWKFAVEKSIGLAKLRSEEDE